MPEPRPGNDDTGVAHRTVDGLHLQRTSSYRPTTFSPDPVRVEWDVQYVDSDSEEGRHLQAVQGAAFRKVLEWLARNPPRSRRTEA